MVSNSVCIGELPVRVDQEWGDDVECWGCVAMVRFRCCAGCWSGAVVVQVDLNGCLRVSLPRLRGVYTKTDQAAGW
jgi:hypothetical protein